MRPPRSRRVKQKKPTLNKRKRKTCKKCKKSMKNCKKNKCKSRKRRRRRPVKKGGNPYDVMQDAYHGGVDAAGKLYDAAFGHANTSTSPFLTSRVL
tara:strand:- start:26697 stop:26984 length:288 start_codon:yes stop_codon:yes gene_type:complete